MCVHQDHALLLYYIEVCLGIFSQARSLLHAERQKHLIIFNDKYLMHWYTPSRYIQDVHTPSRLYASRRHFSLPLSCHTKCIISY